MILRDLDVLAAAAERTDVRVNFSIGTLDEEVWRISEPGTPPPWRRVEALARLNEAGLPCGVLVAPILPGLSDGDEQLSAVVQACVEAGAVSISSIGLHLRPGVRELFMPWLARERPDLVERYEALYGARSGYLARDEAERLGARVRALVERHGGCARSPRRRASRRRPRRARAAPRPSRSCAWSADEAAAGYGLGMPLQNRVTPFSELVADPARGLLYGNRGCMHDDAGRIRRRYGTRRWIACRLEFRGWQRGPKLQPGRFTELFFLDEVTAFAAGHRPCALCRRADYVRLGEIWRELHPGQVGADAIDLQLHGERVAPGTRAQRHHPAALDDLPDGAFVVRDGEPWLVLGSRAPALDARGLHRARAAPGHAGTATVITPPSLVAVLRTGWEPLVPLFHPSAA